jgi:TolB-like protein
MLDIALYNDRANLRESTDSAKAILATEKLVDTLAHSAGVHLIDRDSVRAAASSPKAIAAAGSQPCNVIVACARAVGRQLGAPWVVMGKLSKTSNLIWTFSGQLINVKTGELVIDDTFELKGDPDQMVPPGMGVFAQRVSRRVSGEPAA